MYNGKEKNAVLKTTLKQPYCQNVNVMRQWVSIQIVAYKTILLKLVDKQNI